MLAEMNTPKGVDISRFMTDARRIKGRVDAVVIPDMDNGVMRMSALAGGVLAQQQGLEAVIHVYGRDRNRMAIQGDLLAAHVLGIQNLIVVHSETMDNGDHRDAKSVDDLDEVAKTVKQAVREAAAREHRSVANMVEVLIRRHCSEAGIPIPEQEKLFAESSNG